MKNLVHAILGALLPLLVQGGEEVAYLHGEYNPAKWPSITLALSQAGTVKNFFDSGLRPYRHPGVETSTLEVKHLNLEIQLASGKVLPKVPAQVINIQPFSDGEIDNFDGFTQRLTLEEARAEMMKWLPFSANGRTEADLDAYLKAVETDYVDFDDPHRGDPSGCGIGWKEPGWKERGGGPQCSVWFRKSMSNTHPLFLYFKFSWGLNRPSKDARYYRVPIPPPPGYEHVSMEAPEKFGPDSTVDMLRAKGVDIGESPDAGQERETAKKNSAHDRRDETRPNVRKDSKDANLEMADSFPWLIVASAIAIFTVIFVVLLKLRKPKTTL